MTYCPFCGDTHHIIRVHQTSAMWHSWVECSHCCARGADEGADTEQEAKDLALADWNDAFRSPSIRQRATQIKSNISYIFGDWWEHISSLGDRI